MTLFKKEKAQPAPKSATTEPTSKKVNLLYKPTLISCVLGNQPVCPTNGVKEPIKNKKLKKEKSKNGKNITNGHFPAITQPLTSKFEKAYHWQSDGAKKSSVDDMVLLRKISEAEITDNLHKRFMEDKIYTYIGPVLVAVNPFKQMPYFTEKEVQLYQGAALYEVPPHVYAVADSMYRNMLIDSESQCVIISGESGAGKTVSAKYIMNYITRVSGGGAQVQTVKEIILESNPLLEAFGNAKTIRNNNSSRFGKYIEIEFRGGEPKGGKISNFLLEKSRVHCLNEGERSFHIFYQLCSCDDSDLCSQLGITSPDYYNYLNQSGVYTVDGTNDSSDFNETLKAMAVMGIGQETHMDILSVVAAILHMGNITFVEDRNEGRIENEDFLQYPALLLGISPDDLARKLTSRVFDAVSERVDVPLNCEQAQFARDAWAKSLYARLFDYIVETVNVAMKTDAKEMNLGILDIYGFEIFTRNGFEQFCINYVNEKLQQIFIELTLKNEQEEYKEEGIDWKPISFFNNKVVCDLIESRRPPGIFSVLDDTVATMSAVSEGADGDFRNKMTAQVGGNVHYMIFKDGFTIKHYAGRVDYHIEGFCEKNRDVLFVDIIEVMKSSSKPFVRKLFPENVSSTVKGRPTTVAAKIRSQANMLVTRLSSCVPHYIRCIKPNETKKPKDWNGAMVRDQVEYLGLKENIKVKRAGFAYRRPFEKFIRRYAILAKDKLPTLLSEERRGIATIMAVVNMDASQYQLGHTKCFIKDPESLYMLEEFRERKFSYYARILQKAFRKYFSTQRYHKDKLEACNVLQNKKQRRSNSINRNFYGDYVGIDSNPNLVKLIPKRDKIEFALTVVKYDRRFKTSLRDLILTQRSLYLIGIAKIQNGPNKGKMVEVIKRSIDLENISRITLSTLADNFILIHINNDFESLLEVNLKTEFLMLLNRKLKEKIHKNLTIVFSNNFSYGVKKIRFGRSGTRYVEFREGPTGKKTDDPSLTTSGSTLNVCIPTQLPAGTQSSARKITPEVRMYSHHRSTPKNSQGSQGPLNNNNLKGPRVSNTANGSAKFNAAKINARGTNEAVVSKIGKVVGKIGKVAQTPSFRLPLNQHWPPGAPPPPEQPAPENQPVVAKPPVVRPKPKLNQAKAIYGYDAQESSELTFVEGDILELITEDDSGWWTCSFKNKKGFCPGNYLEKI